MYLAILKSLFFGKVLFKMEWLFGSNKKESAEGVKPKGSLGTSTPNEVDDSWYRDKGNEAFEQADYHEALSLYTQGIVRQPSAVLYCNRSATAFALGDYKLALEDADRSLAMDGTWVKPFLRKGRALSALGRYKEAANVMANGLSLSISGVKEKTRQIETELEYDTSAIWVYFQLMRVG